MKKYKLTNEVNKRGLRRIAALKGIPRYRVKAGDLGGFVESEKNLSQDGDAWVGGNACVSGNAEVFGNAYVSGNACVFGDACVTGNAQVYDNARVFDDVWVYGACVFGNACVFRDARVSGNACVFGNAHVSGNAYVSGNAEVFGNACVSGDVKISSKEDYITFQNWWSSEDSITWTRSNNMWKSVLFYGTAKELLAKAEKEGERSLREYKRLVDYVESILKDEKKASEKKTIHRDSKGRFCKSN